MQGLKMASYLSEERSASGEDPVYDLFAVSNHFGSPQGGHYTAFCRVSPPVPAAGVASTLLGRPATGRRLLLTEMCFGMAASAAADRVARDASSVSSWRGLPAATGLQVPQILGEAKEKDPAQWLSFNDEAVAKMAPAGIDNSCAYMIFYVRRE